MLLPTYEDMDADLVKEWCDIKGKCFIKLMQTLIRHEKRKMEQQVPIVEMIMRDLEKYKEDTVVRGMLTKMEKKIQDYEEEIKESKACKFTSNRLDYRYGYTYTVAKKCDHQRAKVKVDESTEGRSSDSEVSSDAGCSTDEAPVEQLN
ncbi:hypothetical protein NDU88_006994 [Pleurodeles waltl]|uniref:Uncharacterized protein n=1 Tax=Pleurodeles waltl TaxID=8319 RepID=A0AAV7RRV7_PLEWA|nr:hypothetical protein NDU88_006994 [Pleurodeles waltl]